MNLNRTLRTIESVAREVERAAATDDRELGGLRKQMEGLDSKFLSKPISTIGLKFSPSGGLSSEQVQLSSGAKSITFGPIEANPPTSQFDPKSYEEDGVCIEPFGLYTSEWFTVVPIRVSNSNPNFRPKLNWVKKTDRSSSLVFLLDAQNSEYYYPVETDFTGEILEGHPRVGLFAFEKFRVPTSKVELHLSGVRLSDMGPSSVKFVLEDEDLVHQIDNNLSAKSFAERFDDELQTHQEAQAAASGCSVVALLFGASAIAATALAVGLV